MNLHRLASSPGQYHLRAVAQQVERFAVGRQLVRLRHRRAQRVHRQQRLGFGPHGRIDRRMRRDQQFSTSGSSSGRSYAAIATSSR
jgi:hypothetical protein